MFDDFHFCFFSVLRSKSLCSHYRLGCPRHHRIYSFILKKKSHISGCKPTQYYALVIDAHEKGRPIISWKPTTIEYDCIVENRFPSLVRKLRIALGSNTSYMKCCSEERPITRYCHQTVLMVRNVVKLHPNKAFIFKVPIITNFMVSQDSQVPKAKSVTPYGRRQLTYYVLGSV